MNLFDAKKLRPMRFRSGMGAFHSPDYLFEMDVQGARCIAYLSGDKTELRNARNMDLLPLFPELSMLHKAAKVPCVLDGHIIVQTNGMPDKAALAKRLGAYSPAVHVSAASHPSLFMAFDILQLGHEPLMDVQLLQRRRLLADTLSRTEHLSVSMAVDTAGFALFELSRQQDLPGILARHKKSIYMPGESSPQCFRIDSRASEMYIACGLMGKEEPSLLLGRFEGTRLAYRGRLSPGVTFEGISHFATASHCPFESIPEGTESAAWFDPLRICLVRKTQNDPVWRLEAFL